MSKQTLKLNASKQVIYLDSANKNNIVVSYSVKHNDDGFKYLIGYSHDDDVIRPLCIVLPRMSGYIKYFDNGGKNISFKIEDECLFKIH